jgi:Family of unknown function (DUF6518)
MEATGMEAAGMALSWSSRGRDRWLWPAAVAGGSVLGAVSVYPYEYVSGSAHLLGNSAAIWLLLPFGAGALAARPVRGAIAGGVALLATVLAFYGVMRLLFPDGHFGAIGLFWLGAAVIGGPVFGAAGSWWRTGPPAVAGLASAVLGAAFIAEAVAFQRSMGTDAAVMAEALFGAALPVALARGRRQRLVALVVLPVLIVIGIAGWYLTWHLLALSFNLG